MRLDRLPWRDVATRAGSCVLTVPVGSTEQHGPHLPLSTDTDIAQALCDRLASRRPDILVAPALAYGSAGEHAGFPGTISLGADATEEALVELGRSADDFAGLLLVSAHGGNAAPVAAAVRRLQAESRRVWAWSPPAPPPGAGGDSHAGVVETSVMLALRPDDVRLCRAEAGRTEPLAELMPALRSGGVRAVSPNGVLGDPRGATAERGEAVLEAWTVALADAVAAWA